MAYDYVFKMSKCPVCGKEFHPAPYHAWTIQGDKKQGCSYTCARKWDKEQERKRQAAKRKARQLKNEQ